VVCFRHIIVNTLHKCDDNNNNNNNTVLQDADKRLRQRSVKLLNMRIDVFRPETPTFTLYEFCEYFYLKIYTTYQYLPLTRQNFTYSKTKGSAAIYVEH